MYCEIAFVFLLQCLLFCNAATLPRQQQQHPCQRACEVNTKPMTCEYNFNLETYASMNTYCGNCPFNMENCFRPGCVPAEGRSKALYLINRQLPGPAIEVCYGDRVIVNLSNSLMTETTNLHWHGLRMKDFPFMDGVPYVTQCPIPPGASFRYDFVPDRYGTYIWHSHSNEQRGEGTFGALIVRSAADRHRDLYDRDEHFMILTDWTRMMGIENYALTMFTTEQVLPHTILVNGLGRFQPIAGPNGTSKHMPTAVFRVQKGLRHKIRMMNVGAQDCPLDISIDNHTMLVISTDGQDVEPVEVDSVRILTGERFDVIVKVDQKIDNYWIRIRGKEGSNCTCDRTRAHQVAVLRYEGAPEVEPTSEVGYDIPSSDNRRQVNPYNKGTESPGALSIPTLSFFGDEDPTSKTEPDYKFFLNYDYVNLDEKKLRFIHEKPNVNALKTNVQLNHINLKLPSFPPLTQPEMVKPDSFCNSKTHPNCKYEYCWCTHALSVNLNSVVELIFIDEGFNKFNHPMHLHGYSFRVMAMEKLGNTTTIEEVKKLDAEGKIKRKLKSAPLKDTVMTPSGGYTVVRFYANNPGYWLLHCHIELHADVGMGLVFKVGEHTDFVKPPKDFPKCGI